MSGEAAVAVVVALSGAPVSVEGTCGRSKRSQMPSRRARTSTSLEDRPSFVRAAVTRSISSNSGSCRRWRYAASHPEPAATASSSATADRSRAGWCSDVVAVTRGTLTMGGTEARTSSAGSPVDAA